MGLHGTTLHRSSIVLLLERQICAKDLVLCRRQMVEPGSLSSEPGGRPTLLSWAKVRASCFARLCRLGKPGRRGEALQIPEGVLLPVVPGT